jgi:heptosyltransferase-2
MATWLADCRKLLVRAPNWLGDTVMCLPALAAVKRAAPEVRLTLAVPEHLAGLFAGAADVDAVLPINRRGSLLVLGRLYRAGGFDSALLLPNSFGSALAAWLGRVRRRAGFSRDGRRWLLTEPVACPPPTRALHQAEYYLELVHRLGAEVADFDRRATVRLTAPKNVRRDVANLLGAERTRPEAPLVVLAPCAVGSGKEWPAARFGRLAALLWAKGFEVVLVGSPAERDKTAVVARGARDYGARVLDLSGRNTVVGMAALFERAAAFAGNDSGPMHLAGAMGLPAVGIFVATDPALYRPLGPRATAIGGPDQSPAPEAVAALIGSLVGRSGAAPASPAAAPDRNSKAEWDWQ